MQRVQSFSSLPPVIFHKYEIEKTLENGVFGEVLKVIVLLQNNSDDVLTDPKRDFSRLVKIDSDTLGGKEITSDFE